MEWTLVAVKWEDITSLARFNLGQDFDEKRLYKLSVGFLIKEAEDYVVIADDVDLTSEGDSYNNYGTLIPRGCIRDWRVIHTLDLPADGLPSGSGGHSLPAPVPVRHGRRLSEFLRRNPDLLASVEEIALCLGMDPSEAEHELGRLEADQLVARMRGPKGNELFVGPGIKADYARSPRRGKQGKGKK